MKYRTVTEKNIVHSLLKRQKSGKRFSVRCRRGGTDLFTYRYPKQQLCVDQSEDMKNVMDSLDRCGILNLRCEYYPSTLRPRMGVKYDSILMKGFGEWFQGMIENKQEIFLDTNMIIYHTCSKAIRNVLQKPMEFLKMLRIPRLVLLELEAKFNRAKRGLSNSVKALGKVTERSAKRKVEASIEKHERDMRIMISALTEVQRLKTYGAQTNLSPLNPDLLAAYYAHAGKEFTDPFIRKEILDSTRRHPTQLAFLSRDLMNVLAACAENIDSFYFSQPNKSIFRINFDQMAMVLIETAITFGEIRLPGLHPRKVTILKGMWSTKSNIDWLLGRLLMRTY